MMPWNCVGGASKSASLDPSGRRAFTPAAGVACVRKRGSVAHQTQAVSLQTCASGERMWGLGVHAEGGGEGGC